jgi:hypothetical protein
MRLSDDVKRVLRSRCPPQPFVIFDLDDAHKRYPGKSNEEIVALPKEDLYKVKILAFCPSKICGAGSLWSLVKGDKKNMTAVTGTEVIQNGSFLVDKWDPEKEGTKQLHEIVIENKAESLRKISVIAKQVKDLIEITRQENAAATKIRNNDIRWNERFAELVEYVSENFKLPSQRESKLGGWYRDERNKSLTTARGDRMQRMKAIVSILYKGTHLRKLGSDEKIRVKEMISDLQKSLA